jgi:hypothetical protein
MPSVIDRAARTLRRIDGVAFTASEEEIAVLPASADGFVVRMWMVHDREYHVAYDRWEHVFDRAEDAYDCFEYGLSDSCRLRITLRGDAPVAWHVEKREYGMWAPGHRPLRRRLVPFWRPARVVYRQNRVFRRHEPAAREHEGHDEPSETRRNPTQPDPTRQNLPQPDKT